MFVCIALAVILVIAVAVFISVAVAILISAAVVAGKLWKFPPESSWRQLGGSTASPWRCLEGSRRFLESHWRVLGVLEIVLDASRELLG